MIVKEYLLAKKKIIIIGIVIMLVISGVYLEKRGIESQERKTIDKIARSIVFIITNEANLGSGFVVDDEGYILTGIHVVGGKTFQIFFLENGIPFPSEGYIGEEEGFPNSGTCSYINPSTKICQDLDIIKINPIHKLVNVSVMKDYYSNYETIKNSDLIAFGFPGPIQKIEGNSLKKIEKYNEKLPSIKEIYPLDGLYLMEFLNNMSNVTGGMSGGPVILLENEKAIGGIYQASENLLILTDLSGVEKEIRHLKEENK